MPQYSTRDDLLAQCHTRYLDVPIQEVGLTFRIRSLSEFEKTAYETTPARTKNESERRRRVLDSRRRLVALCLVDADGKRLFGDGEHDQLSKIDGLVMGRLFDACWSHCGLDDPGTSVEELVKNFEASLEGSLPSGSQDTSPEPSMLTPSASE